jgi:hypothetical protein
MSKVKDTFNSKISAADINYTYMNGLGLLHILLEVQLSLVSL